jgi:hypothetical protein
MFSFVVAGLFLVALVFSAYWHNSQNKRLISQFRRDLDKETAQWLGDFAWARTFQLWAALACAVLFTAVTGWELYSARQTIGDFDVALKKSVDEINKSRTQIAQMQQITSHYPPLAGNAAPAKPQPPVAQPQIQSAPTPVATANAAPVDAPPVNPPAWPQNNTAATQETQPQAQMQQVQAPQQVAQVPNVSVTAQAVDGYNDAADLAPSAQNVTIISGLNDINPDAANQQVTRDFTNDAQVETQLNTQLASKNNGPTVEEVYNPEEMSSDKQSTMDSIKKRYESLLVNYLFLKKCGLINPQDYHAIISALAREMSSVNAPGRLEHDIMTAAKGSYDEMYAKSNCNDQNTSQLHAQYSDYINTISQNLPTP